MRKGLFGQADIFISLVTFAHFPHLVLFFSIKRKNIFPILHAAIIVLVLPPPPKKKKGQTD